MEVFVGNLNNTVSFRDLALLLKDFKKPQIKLVEKAQADGVMLRYAVVTFDSARLAKKAINRFHTHELRGQPLVMREFVYRSYVNERRALDWRNRPWSGPERRRTDRRKAQLLATADTFPVEPSAPAPAAKAREPELRVAAYKDMARKY